VKDFHNENVKTKNYVGYSDGELGYKVINWGNVSFHLSSQSFP
jgi:hypothetical protein